MDTDFALSTAKEAFAGESEKIQAVRDIITTCADVTDVDRCEASSKIFACAGVFSESKGYDEASIL